MNNYVKLLKVIYKYEQSFGGGDCTDRYIK